MSTGALHGGSRVQVRPGPGSNTLPQESHHSQGPYAASTEHRLTEIRHVPPRRPATCFLLVFAAMRERCNSACSPRHTALARYRRGRGMPDSLFLTNLYIAMAGRPSDHSRRALLVKTGKPPAPPLMKVHKWCIPCGKHVPRWLSVHSVKGPMAWVALSAPP